MSGQWERHGAPHDCREGMPPPESAPERSIWRCTCGKRWEIRMARDFVGGGFKNPDKCWISLGEADDAP